VARASDLAGITDAKGAPSFAHSAKGGHSQPRATIDTNTVT
jgi:hypothetical protein